MMRPQVMIGAVIFAVALVIPLFLHNDYFLQVIFRLFLFATLGLAWNLVGGYTGQLSLGHAAFFGIGAYGLALLSKSVSPWLAIGGGVVLSLVAAVIIGSVSFRLRGPYFCLATIAFAEVVRLIAKNLPNVTGGDVGVSVVSLFPRNTMVSFYYACVVLTMAAFAITYWVERSRFGYYLMAIREDEDTALSVGVNTARVKLWALMLSAALSALAGALYASLFLYIVPDQVLGIELSVEIAILPMLGGAGTLLGPLVGCAGIGNGERGVQEHLQGSAPADLRHPGGAGSAVPAGRNCGYADAEAALVQAGAGGAVFEHAAARTGGGEQARAIAAAGVSCKFLSFGCKRLREGHGFSRAASRKKGLRALAPEVSLAFRYGVAGNQEREQAVWRTEGRLGSLDDGRCR